MESAFAIAELTGLLLALAPRRAHSLSRTTRARPGMENGPAHAMVLSRLRGSDDPLSLTSFHEAKRTALSSI